MSFTLTSDAFPPGGAIPPRYTCDGEDISPPLRWSDPPPGTKSLVLIVVDPDAPDPAAPVRTWVHWVVYNLPPECRELPEGAGRTDIPAEAREGLNDWRRTGYGGPCPPRGRHRYFHELYALDIVLPALEAATKEEVERRMEAHVLAKAELIGTYERAR